MAVSIQTLENLLLNNVLDLRFVRRIPLANKPATRRMLCTKSYDLLNSTNGRIVLNYTPPRQNKQFNEAKQNACIVWDILMQDYRIVSADQVTIIRQIPANEQFWTFFNNEIYTLNTEQKILYMES
jgi:hypothetical protein